jgi:CheY-like chemotaxis protein
MSKEPTTPPANVLVVEDEMVLRMRAVEIVEEAGFNPIEATDADKALAILETLTFHSCSLTSKCPAVSTG